MALETANEHVREVLSSSTELDSAARSATKVHHELTLMWGHPLLRRPTACMRWPAARGHKSHCLELAATCLKAGNVKTRI